jgi:DNA polymerase III subunit chi
VTEVWFYHLQRETLEAALTPLLQKTLERGWRAVVRAGSPERAEALDQHLWTFREDSFLPHGRAEDGFAERQPVYLTAGVERPNGAQVLFLVDGAEPGPWASAGIAAYTRTVLVFDGRDDEALARARAHWKDAKAAGHAVTYWQQTPEGRWEKKA